MPKSEKLFTYLPVKVQNKNQFPVKMSTRRVSRENPIQNYIKKRRRSKLRHLTDKDRKMRPQNSPQV